jgi:hypothetical protein
MEPSPLIATHVQQCFSHFHQTCASFSMAEVSIKRKAGSFSLEDQLGRFRLWCGDVAAHQRGRSSLDYKLREASHIREGVIRLLMHLDSILEEANDIIMGHRTPWEDLSESDSETDEEDPVEPQNNVSEVTELQQLISNTAEVVTCLMRLSIAIRNPAPHNQYKESRHIDMSYFEKFDIEHVCAKFPNAPAYLTERLGAAISRRRQYLRYRKDHQERLKQGLEQTELPQAIYEHKETSVGQSERIESTVVSSIPLAMRTSGPTIQVEKHDYYEDVLSQTSYASSNNDPVKLRPPPLPEQGHNGEPFECPLCCRLSSVSQTSAWHKHVFRDIKPYMCSFADCKAPDTMFESRSMWFTHELQDHRLWFECLDGCNRPFACAQSFRQHLLDVHLHMASEHRVRDVMRSCERPAKTESKADCPLCGISLQSLVQLRRHVGKHHEELALFALPSSVRDDQDEADDGNNNSDTTSVHYTSVSATSVKSESNVHPISALEFVESQLRSFDHEIAASAYDLPEGFFEHLRIQAEKAENKTNLEAEETGDPCVKDVFLHLCIQTDPTLRTANLLFKYFYNVLLLFGNPDRRSERWRPEDITCLYLTQFIQWLILELEREPWVHTMIPLRTRLSNLASILHTYWTEVNGQDVNQEALEEAKQLFNIRMNWMMEQAGSFDPDTEGKSGTDTERPRGDSNIHFSKKTTEGPSTHSGEVATSVIDRGSMLMPAAESAHERADDTTENARDRTTGDLDIALESDEEYLQHWEPAQTQNLVRHYRAATIDFADTEVLDGLRNDVPGHLRRTASGTPMDPSTDGVFALVRRPLDSV